jgi:hypothetical protein
MTRRGGFRNVRPEARRCPTCQRGMALIRSSPGDPFSPKFCRWSREGKCSYTAEVAQKEREQRRREVLGDGG